MKLTDELKCFIKEHENEDTTTLLLKKGRYRDIDLPFAVEQIKARKNIRHKLPAWYGNDNLVYASALSTEQASGEWTARYKGRLIPEGCRLCDLTGGLGVDTYYFSLRASRVCYVERFAEYCAAARLNFAALGADNVEVVEGDSVQLSGSLEAPDVYYLDPARRGSGNRRLYALEDCEPNLLELKDRLLARAPKVIAKISPMADVRHTLDLLPETAAVHILSVRNECKELLFVLERGAKTASPPVVCVNFTAEGNEQPFVFTLEEEQGERLVPAREMGRYLYEPHASIMKGGAFKCVTKRFGVEKLHVNSHLYTSPEVVDDFPGRVFEIEEVIPFSSKVVKTLARTLPRANVAVRNFPLAADALRSRLKLTDGGDVYLFGTIWHENEKVLLKCHKAVTIQHNT